MRLLPALALLIAAAPASAQRAPAPPDLPESLGLNDVQREQLEALRERAEALRLRLSAGDSVAVASPCDAGVPMPTPFDEGGAAPVPMPGMEMRGPGPVPMPNRCDGGGVAALQAVPVRPALPGRPLRVVPRLRERVVPPRFFPPAAPPPGAR